MVSENLGEVLFGIIASLSIGVLLIVIFGGLLVVVLLLVARIKLFKKAGVEGWKAIIPFYGTYVFFCQICEIHWGFFVAFCFLTFGGFTALVNAIILAIAFYNLALKCHRDTAATTIFGAIFSGIVTLVYGLSSKYQYDKTVPVGNCGFFNKVLN